jgi:pimeloyl-ACP methyl ester carboxylesterase
MADYLASFVKLRYRNKNFTLAGSSLGFVIITRMLQKYPKIAKQVNLLSSVAGLTHKNDFRIKRRNVFLIRLGASIFAFRLPAAGLKYLVFRGPIIKLGYKLLEPLFINEKHSKVRNAETPEERQQRVNFEVNLWQINDVRTYSQTATSMFTLDLTGQHVDLTVHHVAIDNDRYFDNVRVEQHMRSIFSDFKLYKAKAPTHAESVIATAAQAAPYIPVPLRRLLNKKPEA